MRPAAEREEREGAAGSAGDLKKGKKHEFAASKRRRGNCPEKCEREREHSEKRWRM